jgi:hypothetical protein
MMVQVAAKVINKLAGNAFNSGLEGDFFRASSNPFEQTLLTYICIRTMGNFTTLSEFYSGIKVQ